MPINFQMPFRCKRAVSISLNLLHKPTNMKYLESAREELYCF